MVSNNKAEDLLGLHDSDNDSGSEDQLDDSQDSRFSTAKLRSMDSSDDDNDDQEDNDDEDNDQDLEDESGSDGDDMTEQQQDEDGNDNPLADDTDKKKRKKTKLKPMTVAEMEELELANKKSGVCYLSRVPPFMTPKKVRLLLSKYADLGKLYLAPEGKVERTHMDFCTDELPCRPKDHGQTTKVLQEQTSQLYRRLGGIQGQEKSQVFSSVPEHETNR